MNLLKKIFFLLIIALSLNTYAIEQLTNLRVQADRYQWLADKLNIPAIATPFVALSIFGYCIYDDISCIQMGNPWIVAGAALVPIVLQKGLNFRALNLKRDHTNLQQEQRELRRQRARMLLPIQTNSSTLELIRTSPYPAQAA